MSKSMASDRDTSSSPHYPECYRPLAQGFIRVFELEAGNSADPVVGRLVPQTIDGEPYEAVSYVWGDPRKRHDLIVDDTVLSVTANLHGALTAFRHRPVLDSNNGVVRRPVRRVWADALCINQENIPERTTQVELMGPVFAGAIRVLAWLGWEEGEEGRRHTLDAIRFIHSFMEDPEEGLRAARILLLHHDVSVTGPPSRLSLLSEEDRVLFEEQARYWEAVKLFFDIKYFHRAWIVQEVGLAREAILYSALKPPDEGAVWDPGVEDHALELDSIDWSLVGNFTKFLDHRAASLVTHLDLKSWVAHHIVMVWERNDDGMPKCDFLTAMHWVRILGVTDARDRVFSMLGHPTAILDGHLIIKPDYTVTRGLVYTQLVANFIRKTKNLYAVSLVDHEEDPFEGSREWDPQDESRMPSWVPDWHSINRTTPMDWLERDLDVENLDENPDIRIAGGLEGTKGTPTPHLLVKGWVVDEVSAVSRRMETTDFPVTNLTRERAKVNPFWLDRVWETVFPAGEDQTHNPLDVLESLSLALPLGTREKDQKPSPVGPHQTLAEHRNSFAAYVLQYHELRQSATETENEGGEWLPARSLYNSLTPEAQAELRRRAEGANSGGFLECMTWPSMCRVIYRTSLGFVGMGSRITHPGDLVCRVPGSNVLLTLRRIQDSVEPGSISCAFIAPTVMPACMERDIISDRESDEKAVRFRIL